MGKRNLYGKEIDNVDIESSGVVQAIEKHQILIEDLQQQHMLATITTQENKAQLAAIEADVQQKSRALQEQKKLLQEADSSCNGVADIIRRSQQAIQVIEVRENESLRQERRLAEELQQSQEHQSQLKAKSQENDSALEAIELKLEEASAACHESEKEIQKHKNQIVEIEKQLAAVMHNGKKQSPQATLAGIT